MRRLLPSLLCVCSLFGADARAQEEPMVVIVNHSSGIEQLTQDDVINIFMGRYRRLADGRTAEPLDLATNRADFYRALVNKTLPEINSYWARLSFSGRGTPPQQQRDAEAVIAAVQRNPGAIGYVPRRQLSPQVKVVLELAPQ
jgi:ABC-type phosphate transport system substrate-binding protein